MMTGPLQQPERAVLREHLACMTADGTNHIDVDNFFCGAHVYAWEKRAETQNEAEQFTKEVIAEFGRIQNFYPWQGILLFTCGRDVKPDWMKELSPEWIYTCAIAPHLPNQVSANYEEQILISFDGSNCKSVQILFTVVDQPPFPHMSVYQLYRIWTQQRQVAQWEFPIGWSQGGHVVCSDLAAVPHFLLGGDSGTDMLACFNTFVSAILYKVGEEDVQVLAVDTEGHNQNFYQGLPHQLAPAAATAGEALGRLRWLEDEAQKRCQMLDIFQLKSLNDINSAHFPISITNKFLRTVVLVHDLSVLLGQEESEEIVSLLVSIAKMGRRTGIHLFLATEHPTATVLPAALCREIPGRIAFSVDTAEKSKLILGKRGAEHLPHWGQMLYYIPGMRYPIPVTHCCFTNDGFEDRERDYLFPAAAEAVIAQHWVSKVRLEQSFGIDPLRANRLIKYMQQQAFITSSPQGEQYLLQPDAAEWQDFKLRCGTQQALNLFRFNNTMKHNARVAIEAKLYAPQALLMLLLNQITFIIGGTRLDREEKLGNFVSATDFSNQLTHAIRRGKQQQFIKKYYRQGKLSLSEVQQLVDLDATKQIFIDILLHRYLHGRQTMLAASYVPPFFMQAFPVDRLTIVPLAATKDK